jgi:hypothetical protein
MQPPGTGNLVAALILIIAPPEQGTHTGMLRFRSPAASCAPQLETCLERAAHHYNICAVAKGVYLRGQTTKICMLCSICAKLRLHQ